MFRVSPWITYDPAPEARQEGLTRTNNHFYNMPEDVEMDAPQISTLRDEETPEPQPTPARTSKFRVKLLVNENKAKRNGGSGPSASHKHSAPSVESEEEDEDEEEEEDQLIDDEDEESKTAVPSTAATPDKRGTAAKRGTASTGRGRGRGGGRRKVARTDTPTPSGLGSEATGTTSAPAPSGRKRGAGRGGGARAPRKRNAKPAIAIASHLADETGSISESYAATAASSPAAHDDHSPEPIDILSHPQSTISIAPATATEDIVNLEGIPLPLYPLPSKPFAVAPPQKLVQSVAPIIPLDKTGKKVRHWRQANREVRGIAGGRWFAKCWIGEKESEFASTQAAAAAAAALQSSSQAIADRENLSNLSSVAIPKLPGISLSARGPGRPRIHPKIESNLTTNASSRAQSIASDSAPTPSVPKKRTHTQMSSAAETPSISTPVP
ncbi:hypothetical protein NM688_g5614 [Phlebia brevispora]|uniref:Uncharacterized protein n=1 Tax=Phlebia brevispora TaxID=194682 RepID=A0ACC1SSK3_9APHY|nr:hypothetical protein NM688_g5614 [Phlebia brevispora]